MMPRKKFKRDPDQHDEQDYEVITIDEPAVQVVKAEPTEEKDEKCPYLNTIDRKTLDFDFEKLCTVSLSKVNVYACLVCGKYFQGRGKSTHAFTHSVSEFHHIFLNLDTHKFYCLPDNYEIHDPSFEDILYVLKPTFTEADIDKLDKLDDPVMAYDGKLYFPGIVGLNNLKYNDYCNVIFQALSHCIPFRNYFLIESNYTSTTKQSDKNSKRENSKRDDKYLLLYRFGELVRKLWNPRNFKAHVSPHEMLQAIVLTSKKKFEFTKQGDPIVFVGWFLNSLMGPKRPKDGDTIIDTTFKGRVRISTRLLVPNISAESNEREPELIPVEEEKIQITNFLYLTLDLPSMPLFPKKDEKGKIIKPRISIYELLSKYDGKTTHQVQMHNECSIKRYELVKLPRYLILYYKRFTKNSFFIEKNTYIVDFPINNLDLSNFLVKNNSSSDSEGNGRDSKGLEESDDLVVISKKQEANYTLIANIVHDGEPEAGKGFYRAHILHRGTSKWYELQDLYVTEIPDTHLITLSESYIQIWELKE